MQVEKLFLIFCSVTTLSVIAGCSDNSDEDGQVVVSEAEEENVDETAENAVTTEADSSPVEDESNATNSNASDDNDTSSNEAEETQSNTDDEEQEDNKENVDETTESAETAEADSASAEDEGNTTDSKASDDNDTSSNESEEARSNTDQEEQENGLSEYTSAQIEYARVWHQLGVHQEIDELNVLHIPEGTPMNPKDEKSAAYPEDVIQLAGSRNIDGSITYSGNGDGTINVYNVPHRWDGDYTNVGDEFYEEIINTTELVMIEPTEGEDIKRLIELISVQSQN